MRRNGRTTTLVVGGLVIASLTACSDGGGQDVEEEPKEALSEAVEALGDYDGIELTLGVEGDADAMAVAAGEDLDDDDLALLLDSSIVVRAAGESEEDAQAGVLVDLAGEEVLELRFLPGQELYVRVDIDAASSALDDPTLTEGVDDLVASAEQFGFGDLATAVTAGDWVKLTGLEQLTELAGGGQSTEEPSDEEVEDVRDSIVSSLEAFLDEDVEVTYRGEEDAGERVTATTTQAALSRLAEEISTIAGDLGVDGEQLGLDTDLPEGSDEPVEIDVWLDGGRISQVGIDLAAMEGTEGDDVPEGTFVMIGIDEFTGTVEAPDDATEVDLFSLFGGLMGGLGGPGGLDGAGDAGADLGGDDAAPGEGLSGGCIEEDQLEELTGGDPAAEAELEAAIDAGFLEVC